MIQTLTPPLLLPTFEPRVTHPAKYSADILRVMARYLRPAWKVYDCFGGVGGLHRIASQTGAKTFCGDIEYRVIANARGTRSLTANAIELPFADETFDAVATSPVYANRMSDTARGWTQRYEYRTYDRVFGFTLHPDNAGAMQFNDKYKRLHENEWAEAYRVLKPGGVFILNISDHIRAGKRVYVSKFHLEALRGLGLRLTDTHTIRTPRLKFGAHADKRTCSEFVFVLEK